MSIFSCGVGLVRRSGDGVTARRNTGVFCAAHVAVCRSGWGHPGKHSWLRRAGRCGRFWEDSIDTSLKLDGERTACRLMGTRLTTSELRSPLRDMWGSNSTYACVKTHSRRGSSAARRLYHGYAVGALIVQGQSFWTCRTTPLKLIKLMCRHAKFRDSRV